MTMTVMKLFPMGEIRFDEGQYLKSADIEADNGRGRVELTPNVHEAMRFKDSLDALLYWKQQSVTYPLRADGKPNRPLTALHAMMERVDK